jgi:hypothetical protein
MVADVGLALDAGPEICAGGHEFLEDSDQLGCESSNRDGDTVTVFVVELHFDGMGSGREWIGDGGERDGCCAGAASVGDKKVDNVQRDAVDDVV